MPIALSSTKTGRFLLSMPARSGRGDTVYDSWHNVPVLARAPGALRNCTLFKVWLLPAAMERVRHKLVGADASPKFHDPLTNTAIKMVL